VPDLQQPRVTTGAGAETTTGAKPTFSLGLMTQPEVDSNAPPAIDKDHKLRYFVFIFASSFTLFAGFL
jgi:hypothetical protein